MAITKEEFEQFKKERKEWENNKRKIALEIIKIFKSNSLSVAAFANGM